MSTSTRISMAGFLATAVTFGPARMGFGLFLPQFRETFGFGTAASGYIAGGAFLGFFLALFSAAVLTATSGPRVPVIGGGFVAALGMAIVAMAPNAWVLALGIAVAAVSAGLAWVPYNNVSERIIPHRLQGRVLSVVSTGTTFGLIATGLLAFAFFATGTPWQIAWWIFAASGLAVAVANIYAIGGLGRDPQSTGSVLGDFTGDSDLRRLLTRKTLPLYAIALSFGLTNGTYLSYWIDHISGSGLEGISPGLVGPILFVVFGVAGIAGLFTGDLEERVGLSPLLRGIFLASFVSLVALGWLPHSWPAVVLSAALQGAALMMMSAVFSFWSERLFPHLPSTSMTAALMVLAIGNIVGPPVVGLVAGFAGLGATLAGLGLLSLAVVVLLPRRLPAGSPQEAPETPRSASASALQER